jgi:hypothetical protein
MKVLYHGSKEVISKIHDYPMCCTDNEEDAATYGEVFAFKAREGKELNLMSIGIPPMLISGLIRNYKKEGYDYLITGSKTFGSAKKIRMTIALNPQKTLTRIYEV